MGDVLMPRGLRNGGFALAAWLAVFGAAYFDMGRPAFAADIEEPPGADLRMAQRAKRVCVDNCITQCRSALTTCASNSKDTSTCRTQFQICARRCVVACNSR